MKVLVINSGSSSLKYQLINTDDEVVIAKGLCERISLKGGKITHKITGGNNITRDRDFPTHFEALNEVVALLTTGEDKVINDMSEISAAGHRAIQAKEPYNKGSVLVTDDVIEKIEALKDLFPLHTPPHINGIKTVRKIFGDNFPQVAVFDTSFHQTLEEKAFVFGLPYEFYKEHGLRKIGFHGTSYRYITDRVAKLINKPNKDFKMIACHLGNGSSITAIKDGKSVDTSMGISPSDGVVMGTRCGAIDAGIVPFMLKNYGLTLEQVEDIMNKKSGFLGISGVGSDEREVEEAAHNGNKRAKLALDIQRYQIKKFIGSYMAVLNGADVIAFTGGIGENSIDSRLTICSNLESLGIEIDPKLNQELNHGEGVISTSNSKVKIMIVPTNEEIMIARDTKDIISNLD